MDENAERWLRAVSKITSWIGLTGGLFSAWVGLQIGSTAVAVFAVGCLTVAAYTHSVRRRPRPSATGSPTWQLASTDVE